MPWGEPNTVDNYYWIIDFSILMELGLSIEDVFESSNARFFPPRPIVRYPDEGIVFAAECGFCIDPVKSFWHDPFTRFSTLSNTYYHTKDCIFAGFPIDHTEIKIIGDHQRSSNIIAIAKQDYFMFKNGYSDSRYYSYDLFKHDSLWKYAESIRARVDSINKPPKTRNWVEESWAEAPLESSPF